jgi:hypothetical protein
LETQVLSFDHPCVDLQMAATFGLELPTPLEHLFQVAKAAKSMFGAFMMEQRTP